MTLKALGLVDPGTGGERDGDGKKRIDESQDGK